MLAKFARITLRNIEGTPVLVTIDDNDVRRIEVDEAVDIDIDDDQIITVALEPNEPEPDVEFEP
jgi:hypothetical protein